MSIILRKATCEDCDLLFLWANDTLTRKNSLNSSYISHEEHCRWFQSALEDDRMYLYVVQVGVVAVGVARMHIVEGEATISYSLAPEHRGRGYGTQMVAALLAKAPPEVHTFTAKVKHSNIPSCLIFEKLGFEKTDGKELLYTKKNPNSH